MNKRRELVNTLRNMGYIKTDKVKKAMLNVPREEFMTPETRDLAYLDRPIPLKHGQTISAPHMVAMICEQLSLKPGMNVLEIGTGFGYNAAVVAEILGPEGHVYTIERIESLKERAEKNLIKTGFTNVAVIHGDGTAGYPEKAPYDRIYATASAPKIPDPLVDQLKVGGRLLAPIGEDPNYQELICILRGGKTEYQTFNLGGVVFVPMIGEHGWPEE
ncbi:Protein-L-isoaspartate O-methyltransferase [Methanobacterium lacus]|uniref:Protein-L-isoaspartate O-methyltransferase n=1 Tax=Methanobacterium lacus (strain AL-21) TaxID=877455 RepID=F0TB16_METLA|nr:protein-L-isoaspartate(D-aspartate) O-methyltransferase [Methanobacterium lacus]ADZ10162.1 Protein-L-isoaspartate O-methyltransferase [Methanobacterium lacus]